jgi:hypothetical protein
MTRLEKCNLAIELGFDYCINTGNVITPTKKILQKKTKNGYLMLILRNKERKAYYLYAHQFVWFFVKNEIVGILDHINNIKTDNRIFNLRPVNNSQNAMNRKNVKGVYYCKRSEKWVSTIMVDYKKIHLGTFKSKDDALNCYKINKEKYHIINN